MVLHKIKLNKIKNLMFRHCFCTFIRQNKRYEDTITHPTYGTYTFRPYGYGANWQPWFIATRKLFCPII